MKDYIRKAMLIGIGLAATTREKVEESIAELVKKGELSEKEGKELVNELLEKSKKIKEEWDKRVERAVTDALSRLSIPNKKELDELKMRVEALERTLEKGQENEG
ncbi:MAG TPA: phasin family protein [Syntrophales bacterium]|nr:phasin family protein [Syntrophales bacterium]HRT27550.1 phasin family protein [Syntrophales bacterium]HRT70636.1 phasin family protein [Syntrophales bacterium]